MRQTQNLLDALADYTNALYREKGTFTEDLAKIIGDGLKEEELEEVIANLSLQLRARKIEATSQTVMITMCDGSYININKKLKDSIKIG